MSPAGNYAKKGIATQKLKVMGDIKAKEITSQRVIMY